MEEVGCTCGNIWFWRTFYVDFRSESIGIRFHQQFDNLTSSTDNDQKDILPHQIL